MQTVSQYYLDAIANPPCQWDFKIFVKQKKEKPVLCTLRSEDLIEDFQVNRVSLKDTYMGIAGTGSAKIELKLTASGIIKMQNTNRLCKNTFLDVWVWLKTADPNQSDEDITENLDHSENETGRVHIGEFHITTVKSTEFDCDIVAYDAMLAFDRYVRSGDKKNLNRGEHSFEWLLNSFCTRCSKGVYSVVLDDQLDFSDFLNGAMYLGVDKDIDLPNYRSYISYIAQLLGCFAYITRDGKLSFKKFSQTVDWSVGEGSVFEHEFGGVEYEVYGIEMSVAGFPTENLNRPTQAPDNPAEFKLDENPFLRHLEPDDNGSQSEVTQITQTAVDNIASEVMGIKFNGGTCKCTYRPDLDIGDRVNATVRMLVDYTQLDNIVYPYVLCGTVDETFCEFTTITSPDYVGETNSEVKSSNFKGSEGGGGGGGSSTPLASVVHIPGKSNKTITTMSDALYRPASTSIRAEANMPVLVWFTGTFVAETSVHLTLNYEYDGIQTYQPLEYNLMEGRNTISFSVGFDATETELIHHFGLYAKVNSGTVSLAKQDFQLNVYSSGATSSEPTWSGTYIVNDVVPDLLMDEDGLQFTALDDTLEDVDVEFDV